MYIALQMCQRTIQQNTADYQNNNYFSFHCFLNWVASVFNTSVVIVLIFLLLSCYYIIL